MVIYLDITENECVESGTGTLYQKRKFDQYCAITWKQCEIQCKGILFPNK